ncbi:MAG: tRNA (guanosine(37)-N1)-methyltransferase TrmD [Defluviitaleaceae bacterium]|nr:tRNA (guanosine(37)-N1)-methyltransferase TrmD [Defluviitaleaceae bacterium]
MIYHVLTLFPEMIQQAVSHSILGRAANSGHISVNCINIRDFAVNKHGQVDDSPYGGGAGMVMMAPPVYDAYQHVLCNIQKNSDALSKPPLIYLSPQGRVLTQKIAEEIALSQEIILLCGHYEGLDERIIEEIVTDEISIGDYVLTGGEPAAIVLMDAVSRLVPGVLGKAESFKDESFSDGILEYPHYTRPPVFRERAVPEVLLSGHHGNIDAWRKAQAVERTRVKRPDLLGEIKGM